MTRYFNASQRTALYLAADGKCSNCHEALESGWHADHMHPHSKGGATDVVNGQALCAACNLQKGSRTIMSDIPLRAWQVEAKNRFDLRGRPQDFTISATPGAGKTTFTLSHASDLRAIGAINRVIVVVPTDSLRTQWCDAGSTFGFDLRPADDPHDWTRDDYDGVVVTYAQMKSGSVAIDLARRTCSTRQALVVFDEIHHAGEKRSWGDGLTEAFDRAAYRLLLTGTPWRRAKDEPIPFVRYENDLVQVDYAYEYGQAVSDDVCRRIVIEAYDCETVRWVDCGHVIETSLNDELSPLDVPGVLDTIYQPGSEWISTLLTQANTTLSGIRSEVPDAGGLVVAATIFHARAYADALTEITGEAVALVTSDDPRAKDALRDYRAGTSRWIVAVDMVSEGVGIPRFAVGVYASRKQTPLFFRQVVGRFVRTRPNEELNAVMFIPAVPELKRHAAEIENELRHQLELDLEVSDKERELIDNSQRQFTFREPLSATQATLGAAFIGGQELSQADMDRAVAACEREGIPKIYAAQMARVLKQFDANEVKVTVAPQQPIQSRHRMEKQLRMEITRLVGRVEHREGMTVGTLNGQLLRDGWRPRKAMDLEELRELHAHLAARLTDG